MAEIAARSITKICSLYRFLPNKESLADTLVVSARENIDAVFDRFDADVSGLSIRGLTDDLMALTFGLFARPGFMKLLDAGQEWSIKREEFKSALQQRVAKTLMIHSPNPSRKSAGDVALVVLLNVKAVATHRAFSAPTSSVSEEFRDMTRLYLQSRLRSGKRSIPLSRKNPALYAILLNPLYKSFAEALLARLQSLAIEEPKLPPSALDGIDCPT